MTRVHDIVARRSRHRITFLAAVLLAVVTGAASFALAAPERARAGSDLCPREHFCIWEHAGFKGGMYNSGASDRNLVNDDFVNTDRPVANEGSALYNNGRKGRRDDVVVYMGVDDDVHPRGYAASFCVPRRKQIDFVGIDTPEGFPWNDAIVGYRWVTDRECRAAGTR
jgi:Peptidase inhibitor family I36